MSSPLDQPSRRRIHDFVVGHPGSSARGIQRGLRLGWGETAYHLDQLIRAGLLVRERAGGRDYFFPPGMGPEDRLVLAAMQGHVERELLFELARPEGSSFVELVARSSSGKSTIAYHLKYLINVGLVEMQTTGGVRRYRVRSPERVRELYRLYAGPLDIQWSERFASAWGGLVRE